MPFKGTTSLFNSYSEYKCPFSGNAEQGRLGGVGHFLETNGFIFVGKILKIISTWSAKREAEKLEQLKMNLE